MKHKILVIVICMLMIVTIFPVVASSIQTEEIYNSNFTQSQYQLSKPGYTPHLLSNPVQDTLTDVSPVRQPPEKTAATIDDIVINMLEQVDETMYLHYLNELTAFGPRVTGTDACKAAAQYIYNQFESMGLAVRYHHWSNIGWFDDEEYISYNIEATINGADESSNEIYIICAHYDTVDCLGADDDTSGTIAVLMAAYIMSQSQYKFNHTIKFVAFSGEEQGLLGSEIYVADAANEGWNIVGVLNLDMISYAKTTKDGNNLTVYVNDASEWLYNFTLTVNTEYTDYIHLTLHNGGMSSGSDHVYFWMEEYDAIYYEEYHFNPNWHLDSDKIDTINATYAIKNIRLILATLAELSECFNSPPGTPVLTGASSGVINQVYNLSVVTTEPSGQDVYYFIDWGDDQVDEWVGPFHSEAIVVITHQWAKTGEYTIQAKAKNIYKTESDWATLTITMPYSYNKPIIQLFERLFQRFPNAFSLLQQFLEY